LDGTKESLHFSPSISKRRQGTFQLGDSFIQLTTAIKKGVRLQILYDSDLRG
jgi:hypothetical protein